MWICCVSMLENERLRGLEPSCLSLEHAGPASSHLTHELMPIACRADISTYRIMSYITWLLIEATEFWLFYYGHRWHRRTDILSRKIFSSGSWHHGWNFIFYKISKFSRTLWRFDKLKHKIVIRINLYLFWNLSISKWQLNWFLLSYEILILTSTWVEQRRHNEKVDHILQNIVFVE